MRRNSRRLIGGGLIILAVWYLIPAVVQGESKIEQLHRQITERNGAIKQLEAEIQRYQKELDTTSEQAKTLNGEINRLNKTIKKLNTDIRLTETQIDQASLTIEQLSLEIDSQNAALARHGQALGESLRILRQANESQLVEVILSPANLTELWDEESRLTKLQTSLAEAVSKISQLRQEVIQNRDAQEQERQELTAFNRQLADQKQITDQNRQSKDELLALTKNRENNYKKILEDRRTQKEKFEQELFEFENQLRIAIDPESLPRAGSRVLAWPLANPVITQRFGKTVDSARLYVSGTHNGIDLRAAIGTPIRAAAAGVVRGVGDTDLACRGASYGRWVLLEHGNNLSTLYAHLSLIKVAEGQTLAAGDLLGYSGQTGYATGPHLHFTVFATAGVKIDSFPSRSCSGAVFHMPIAPANVYLDPLLYL